MSQEFHLGGDLPVRRLGFGAMRLARDGWNGPPRDPAEGRAVLRRAVALGVDHIDTAGYYRSADGAVRANALIREALRPYPPRLLLATKVGPVFGSNGVRPAPASALRALVEHDLESLGVERLDLVYLRVGAGRAVPRDESIGERFAALARLRDEGLVRHLGISNVGLAQLEEARAIAPVAAVQNGFEVGVREDRELLAACARQGIAFVPFAPLGGGHGGPADPRLVAVAARHGASAAQIALAWLLAVSPATLAIPGTGSLEHLEENMAAAAIVLDADDRATLDAVGAL